MAEKNRVVEMMTKVEFKHYTVRVWSIAKEGDSGPDQRVQRVLLSIQDYHPDPTQISSVIEELGSEVVAAYEIIDQHGHGTVVYPDWK